MTKTHVDRPWWDRFTPRASVRVQMFAAAIVWLIGLGFLLGFGTSFIVRLVRTAHPGFLAVLAIVGVALVLGAIKARYILIRYADKAVARIQHRGHACFFGFFGWSSWGFIAVMMGGGAFLRLATPLPHYAWGLVFLATLYIAVGTGLAIADRIFWVSALRSEPVPESIVEGAAALVSHEGE
jgi:hypothetical protein